MNWHRTQTSALRRVTVRPTSSSGLHFVAVRPKMYTGIKPSTKPVYFQKEYRTKKKLSQLSPFYGIYPQCFPIVRLALGPAMTPSNCSGERRLSCWRISADVSIRRKSDSLTHHYKARYESTRIDCAYCSSVECCTQADRVFAHFKWLDRQACFWPTSYI